MTSAANGIRLILSDVDGVWTRGNVLYGDAREMKEFNIRDGLAVKIAQKAGIEVAVMTSRSSRALVRRCHELGVTQLLQGVSDKVAGMRELLATLNVAPAAVAYIGDDLPDLGPMQLCGLSAAPSDAAPEVLEFVTWKLGTRGGEGALRELVERLLKERGEWQDVVQGFRSGNAKTPNP